MKKRWTAIFCSLAVLMMCTGTAFATGNGSISEPTSEKSSQNHSFIDSRINYSVDGQNAIDLLSPGDSDEDSSGNVIAGDNATDLGSDHDFFWIGNRLSGSCDVGYDALLMGGQIDLREGDIYGSLRSMSETLMVDGVDIYCNISSIGDFIEISDVNAESVYLIGRNVSFYGNCDYLYICGENVTIDGTVKGDVKIVCESLNTGSDLKITGTLWGEAENINIDSNAVIKNNELTQVHRANLIDEFKEKVSSTTINWISVIISFLMALVAWIFMFLLMRRHLDERGSLVRRHPVRILWSGLLAIILIPVAFVILCCTVIGAPVALAFITVCIIAAAFSVVYTGVVLGKAILPKLNTPLASLIGLIIVFALVRIPYAGIFVRLLTVAFTYGCFFVNAWDYRKENPTRHHLKKEDNKARRKAEREAAKARKAEAEAAAKQQAANDCNSSSSAQASDSFDGFSSAQAGDSLNGSSSAQAGGNIDDTAPINGTWRTSGSGSADNDTFNQF